MGMSIWLCKYLLGTERAKLLKAKAKQRFSTLSMAIQSGHRAAFEEALRKNGKKIVDDEYIEDDIEKPQPNEGKS